MTKELKADLSLLCITLVWGASFPVMSAALKYMPPYCLLAFRYFLAAVLLAVFFWKRIAKSNANTVKSGILIGITLLLGGALQNIGLVYTTPSKSGFITGLNVVLVPLFIAVIYKKLPDLKTNIGIVLAISGLATMSIGGKMNLNYGDFLTMLCAAAFAVQIIFVDRYAKDVDVIALTCIETFVVGFGALIPAAGIEKFDMQINMITIAAVLFTALFCTIFAYITQNKMQPYTNPTHAAIIFLAEPVFGAIFSWIAGDKLTGKTLIGCLMIFAGTVIISIKEIRFSRKNDRIEGNGSF